MLRITPATPQRFRESAASKILLLSVWIGVWSAACSQQEPAAQPMGDAPADSESIASSEQRADGGSRPAETDEPSISENGDRPNGGASVETPAGNQESLGLLIDVAELQDRLDDPALRILDARSQADYEEVHVPGAIRVDVGEWRVQALADGGLKDATAWSDLVGRLGITRKTPVVVYAENPTNAARIWWTLKYVGVEQVALLDGGWQQWVFADAPVSEQPRSVEPSEFQPNFQKQRLMEIGDVKESLEGDASKEVVVIDARSIEEYTGTGGPGDRLGRIPGARHIEWKVLLDEEGRFKSKEELQEIFRAQGILSGQTAVTHCQSGGRAALDAFALELAGYEDVKNYYCGWQEWSKDERAPVETDSAVDDDGDADAPPEQD